MVTAKLKDVEELWKEKKQLNAAIETLTAVQQSAEANCDQKTKDVAAIEKKREALQEQLSQAKAALPTVDEEATQQELATIQTALTTWREAAARWKTIYRLEENIAHYKKEKNTAREELERLANQLATATTALEAVALEYQTAQKAVSIARLATAKDTHQLRAQLQPEKPCMVCGSTTHPYATGENPQLDAVLEQLENHVATIAARQASLQKNQTRDTTLVKELQKQDAHFEVQLIKLKQELAPEKTAIQALSETVPVEQWPEQERLLKMEETTAALEEQRLTLAHTLKALRTAKATFETLQEQYNAINSTLQKEADGLREAQYLLKDKTKQREQQQEALQKLQQASNGIITSIESYFSGSDWLMHWESDPSAFRHQLLQFAEKWRANTQALAQAEKNWEAFSHQWTQINEQATAQNLQTQKAHDELALAEKQLKSLEGERKNLFDGAPTTQVAATLASQLESVERDFETAKTKMAIANEALLKTKTTKEALEKQATSVSEEVTIQRAALVNWLSTFNESHQSSLTLTDLQELVMRDGNWAEKEAAALNEIAKQVVQRQTTVKERETQLKSHLEKHPDPIPMATLEAQQTTLKEQTTTYHEENGDLNRQLQSDLENRERLKDLLKKIDKQQSIEEDWGRLSALLGSSSGDKFKRIAQEYTLDILLRYANDHLNILNNRYELQRIPDTLGLQVLDKDMGYEVRTVFSLSGGESFLVSLGLALGLASLSSNRIKVASLFIDEGFGSLDVNTLTVAMDALERLHNDGRKVGVISHVSEMKDRIPTQIQVHKLHGGKSSIKCVVVGNA